MDTISNNGVITIPAPTASELMGSLLVFGGFVLVILFLTAASHLPLSWIEKSSLQTDLMGLAMAGLFAVPLIPKLWSVVDRTPLLVADAASVRLHPSFGIPPLSWGEVRGADVTDVWVHYASRTVLTIFLTRRIRGWRRPFGEDRVTIGEPIGSDEANHLVAVLELINANSTG